MQNQSPPKSIVFLGPSYPYRGGIASFTERLAKEFNDQGYKTELYTFSLQYPSFLFPGKTQFSDAPPPLNLTIKQKVNSINPFNWIKVGRELRNKKPDIIIVRYWIPFMGPCLGTILRCVAKNKHTKIICIADNIIPHEKRIGDSLFTTYFIKPIHAFIALSNEVITDMNTLRIKQKKVMLPHPVFDHFGVKTTKQEALNKLNIKSDGGLILFFGFIRQYKGLDLLIKAMSDQRIKDLGIKLLIAGEFYEPKEKYTDLIASAGLAEQIIIHDQFIPENQIPYYFSAADVLVQPYISATQSGVTPLAFHFDLPMIVTNVGGLKEVVVDKSTGLVTEPNPTSIANSIVEYFATGKNQFEEKLKIHKRQYSWSVFTDGILSLYKQL